MAYTHTHEIRDTMVVAYNKKCRQAKGGKVALPTNTHRHIIYIGQALHIAGNLHLQTVPNYLLMLVRGGRQEAGGILSPAHIHSLTTHSH